MFRLSRVIFPFVLCVCLLAGCAGHPPINYKGLDSTSQMAPNPQHKDRHIPFLYSEPDIDLQRYSSVIFDPVAIYDGPDNQFGKTSGAERTVLASYMQTEFINALKTRYALATEPGPNTLRVHVTLTGVETNTPVLATTSKLGEVNLVITTVQTLCDKQAFFTGSVTYAVEIYDSTSNRLLRAFVSKQYPRAINVFASFRKLDASKAGIHNGATALLERLR